MGQSRAPSAAREGAPTDNVFSDQGICWAFDLIGGETQAFRKTFAKNGFSGSQIAKKADAEWCFGLF